MVKHETPNKPLFVSDCFSLYSRLPLDSVKITDDDLIFFPFSSTFSRYLLSATYRPEMRGERLVSKHLKKAMPMHIIIQLLKATDKEHILKVWEKEKKWHITCKRTEFLLFAYFS